MVQGGGITVSVQELQESSRVIKGSLQFASYKDLTSVIIASVYDIKTFLLDFSLWQIKAFVGMLSHLKEF